MLDTGERREITRFVNAKEAETVQKSTKLVAETKQRSSKTATKTDLASDGMFRPVPRKSLTKPKMIGAIGRLRREWLMKALPIQGHLTGNGIRSRGAAQEKYSVDSRAGALEQLRERKCACLFFG
ncbi:MAG: hypothetical protein DMG14_26025 [Acidobacteria bacterium]|nr:MAG: hypothetical protein DMG14_26025 [Acidobacteriota bacterium]PYS49229.1 MAG: hypothetical protein DMG13_23860 [Acidobacteriota bacterium]